MPDSIHPPISAIFVYGTLQTGESRAHCWPHRPLSIEQASVVGQMHNLGPYPALVEGSLSIAGELWRLAPEHISHTLEVLDAVEAAAGEGKLYERKVVPCRLFETGTDTETGSPCVEAYSYFYAHPEHLAQTPVITPSVDGRCYWKHIEHRPTTLEG